MVFLRVGRLVLSHSHYINYSQCLNKKERSENTTVIASFIVGTLRNHFIKVLLTSKEVLLSN